MSTRVSSDRPLSIAIMPSSDMETVFAIFYLHVHGYYIIFETEGDWWRFSGESRGFVEFVGFVGFVGFVEFVEIARPSAGHPHLNPLPSRERTLVSQ
jgi:hypothetical protein